MKNKITHPFKSLFVDLFNQVYNDELTIPDAVNQVTNIVENFNEYNVNSKIDPLFDYGEIPLLKFHKITNIMMNSNGHYKYFLHNTNHPDLSKWIFEDDLLKLLRDKQKNI